MLPARIQKWGPALLPAPTAPSEGSAGVRDLDRLRSPVPRSWLTSSGVASSHGSVRRQILDLSRPFLDRPSFRALPLPERSKSLRQKDQLFRRLFPGWSGDTPDLRTPRGISTSRLHHHRLPAEIRPLVPGRPWSGFPSRRWPEAAAPITIPMCAWPRVAPSGICAPGPVDNGDIADNLMTLWLDVPAQARSTRLPFRSGIPTSRRCPNPLPCPNSNPPI